VSSADPETIDVPKELAPAVVAGALLLLRKPTGKEAARGLLTWVAASDLDPVLIQVAQYELASTATDKGEQEAWHALSAGGPDPERAAASGLRGGVLAVQRGDADAAEAMFRLGAESAIVETPEGVVTQDAGFWAANQLGALYIGQNRLADAESAYRVATASTNKDVLAAARIGAQRIAQLRSAQQLAAEPPAVG
jgi:hypothetical protein